MKLSIPYLRQHVPTIKDYGILTDIVKHGSRYAFPTGKTILDDKQHIDGIPIITQGGAKIIRCNGPESNLFLYFLMPGETCTMTLSSCLNREISKVRAVTITPTEVVFIPAERVYLYTRKFPAWNTFALQSFQHRFESMVGTVEDIAFRSLTERLMTYLEGITKITGANRIGMTHRELADDLGASRVGLSRVLKTLEYSGVIELSRGQIQLIQTS